MKRTLVRQLYLLGILLTLISSLNGISFPKVVKAQDHGSDLPKIIAQADLPLAGNSLNITLSSLNLLIDSAGQTLYFARNHIGGFSQQGQSSQFSNLVSIATATLEQSNATDATNDLVLSAAINSKTDEILLGTSAFNGVPYGDTPAIKKFTPGGASGNSFSQIANPKGSGVRDILINSNNTRSYVLTSSVPGAEGGTGTILSVFDTTSLAFITDIEPEGTWVGLKTDNQGKLYMHEGSGISFLQGPPPDYKDTIQSIDETTLKVEDKVVFEIGRAHV